MHLLEANPHRIDWLRLSANSAAMHLLDANPNKMNWSFLSFNPAAMHLLEANPDKINWQHIWMNPAIFEYDYVNMKHSRIAMHVELVQRLC